MEKLETEKPPRDSLGDRMKKYESEFSKKLGEKEPIIIRIDGRAFHTVTKTMPRPFFEPLENVMNEVAIELCKQIQGSKFAFVQSDEISIVVHENWRDTFFHRRHNKVVSLSSAIATLEFHLRLPKLNWKIDSEKIHFDSRAFILPSCEEVVNYFIWRQQDWTRNSIQMVARSLYSTPELFNKKIPEMKEMIKEKNQNWDSLSSKRKYGRCVKRKSILIEGVEVKTRDWIVCEQTPQFVSQREFILEELREQGEPLK